MEGRKTKGRGKDKLGGMEGERMNWVGMEGERLD